MRSYRVAESPLDRARGVVRIERLAYPATMSSPNGGAVEFRIGLGEILASDRVHVYRQLMRPDGATREFLIDVDGSGLELVERRAGDDRDERPPASAPSAGTRPVRTPDSGLVAPAPDPLARVSASAGEAPSLRRPPRAGRGLEPGSRRAP